MTATSLDYGDMLVKSLKGLRHLKKVGFLTDRDFIRGKEILKKYGYVKIPCTPENWQKLQAGTWQGW